MKPPTCFSFLCFLCLFVAYISSAAAAPPRDQQAGAVFHVNDFGARPDDNIDDREAIRTAIRAAVNAGPGSVVALSPGEYRVGLSRQELSANPIQGEVPFDKRRFIHFDLKGADGISIQGNDTRLLLTDPRAVLISFQGSINCAFSGVSVDLDPLPFTQGEILTVDRDAHTFDIKIPDAFPLLGEYPWLTLGPQADWQNRLLVFSVASPNDCDRARRDVPMLCYEFTPRLASIRDTLSFEQMGPRVFRIRSGQPLAEEIAPGNTLVYSSKVGGGPLIDAGGRQVGLEDVVIHASPGFVVSAVSADSLQVRRFATRLKPGRLVAGTSDGIHVRATRGGPQIEDSIFEGIQDDIFNISGNPLPIEEIVSGTELILNQYINGLNRGRVAEGDCVYAYAMPEAKIKGEAQVLRLESGSKGWHLILDRPIPGLLTTDMLYSREAGNGGAVIRNCVFRGGLRSAIMHMAGDGTLIEGNTFEYMQSAIAIRQAAESSRNGQGGMVRNVTIRDNIFRGCHMLGVGTHQNHPDAVIGVMLYPDSTSRQIENIVIENNQIIEPGLYGIWLCNVTGASVLNNEIIAWPDSERLPGSGASLRRALRVHESSDIVIDGLVIRDPRPDAGGVAIDSASDGISIDRSSIEAGHAEDVSLAPLFRDHAVLQRDKPVPIWGKAGPGEKVSVSFNGQTQTAVTDDRGRWRVRLAAMPASSIPAELTVRGKNTLTIHNVLVGEVWLCSGQSNMEWLVKDSLNAGQEIAAADFPQIRHFRVPHVAAVSPRDDCGSAWTVCSPASAGAYSAAAYYFGRELHRQLGVPIGLVNSSWGSTQIESWMSLAGLAGDPAGPEVDKRWREEIQTMPAQRAAYEEALAQWNKDAAEAQENGQAFTTAKPSEPLGIGSRQQPSALYNAMIAPLVPYAIRGVIWYQGEANASRYIEYRTLFPSMIRQWRHDFAQGDFPFYYVQLANHRPRQYWAFLREAQEYALKLPATGQAVAIDIGESNNIHPQNKQEVGRRLALNAFAGAYGMEIEYSGPRYAGMAVEQDKVRLRFTHAKGLKTKDPAMPGFELAGSNGKFVPASAYIDGETVVVSAGGISQPVAVRYAWASDPPAPLYNAADLPAAPFRTDQWDE